jgi:DNA-binding IscR family transcriptional regulator
MSVLRKTDYALRVIFSLVEHHGEEQRPNFLYELARGKDVFRQYFEHIMFKKRGKGWVGNVAGRNGGYVLAEPPPAPTMGQIAGKFEGVLSPIACVLVAHHQRCAQELVGRFRRVLLAVTIFTARLMDRVSLAAVAAGKLVTREVVFSDELVGGAGTGLFCRPKDYLNSRI